MHERDPGFRADWHFASNDLRGLRAVRTAALDVLRRYGDPASDFESCAVVLSELMSNAALHGPPGDVRITLDWSAPAPVVAVRDAGRGFVPAFALPPPNREGGRGLFLVTRLAATPEVRVDESGCTVSVRLPVRRLRSSNAP